MPGTTVLLDLDGTITDSLAGIAYSYRSALGALGLPEPADEELRACAGPPLRYNLSLLGVPDERLEEAVDAYRHFFETRGIFENSLYPGASEALKQMHAQGVVLGVATAKLTRYAEAVLTHFGIRELFSTVCGATADGRVAHKDDIVAMALEDLGTPPSSTVSMVGDREHDMYAARRLNLFAVGAMWGYGSAKELLDAGAQVLVRSPAELPHALLSHLERRGGDKGAI